MVSVPQESDFDLVMMDTTIATELQTQLKSVAEKVNEERAKIVDKAIRQLLLKTNCKLSNLRAFHFHDGREYVVAPSGVGFRIYMEWGNKENDYSIILKVVPIMMQKELPNAGSK